MCCLPVDQKPELCMSLTPATQSALAESSYSSYLGNGYLMSMVMVGQWLALSSHSMNQIRPTWLARMIQRSTVDSLFAVSTTGKFFYTPENTLY